MRLIAISVVVAFLVAFFHPALADEKTASLVGREIKSFELSDTRSHPHKLADWEESSVFVVIFLGTECPLAKRYGPQIQELADKYAERNVACVVVNSNHQDTIAELTQFAKTSGLKIPVLKDFDNRVADQFQASRTPEAFVLDAKHRVAYHGRIDDQFTSGRLKPKVPHEYVVEAIDALLADKPVAIPETEPQGCVIGRVPK